MMRIEQTGTGYKIYIKPSKENRMPIASNNISDELFNDVGEITCADDDDR